MLGFLSCLLFLVGISDCLEDDSSNNITCPNPPADNATYPLQFGSMTGSYYFAARINSDNEDFIDFKLSGQAKGWVAVGFSATRAMSANDVFGCKKDSSGSTVYALDTWNPTKHYASNVLDGSQNGVCQYHTEYTNGRINCVFSHYIHVINEGQDYDLNQSLYRIYSALSDKGGPHLEHLHKHSFTPSMTSKKSNIIDDINNNGTSGTPIWPRKILLKCHGIFMITSWLLLATSGIFFAAWMKPVLPNGEWFIAHRILMIVSLFVGMLGFMLPFIANAQYVVPGFLYFSGLTAAHFVIGVIVMTLQIANPIIALCRCKPDSKRRWIFVLIHGHLTGYIVLLLALVNIGIGISLLLQGNIALIIYIILVILYLMIQVGVFVATTAFAYRYGNGEDKKELLHSLFKYMYYFKKDPLDTGFPMEAKICEDPEEEKLVKSNEVSETELKAKFRLCGWGSIILQMLFLSLTITVFVAIIAVSK
ncbi:PREDICTED: putative ferric-chelate reductase 1 [Amphimedon queenslandica]|nr:PREDICTED: putative ferric-chelate reductase 1 [Amphimedon queenslandica]|eukprot:XP_019851677.1 PREDICTED: putative ferric-chelate reductase 1 [Amphimedon queenslandica]